MSSSDFASGGGILESEDGFLHKFVKLKLEGVPNTKQSGTNNFYAYYKKNGSINILEDGFQKTFGDGTSFNYQLFTQSNSNVELQPTGSNGNWFFNFKNGILFFPDPDATNIVNSIKDGKEPYFTFVKYVGRKGMSKLINFDKTDNRPEASNSFKNQLFVDVSENVLYRLDVSNNSLKTKVGLGLDKKPQIKFGKTEHRPTVTDSSANDIYIDTSANLIFRLDMSGNNILKLGLHYHHHLKYHLMKQIIDPMQQMKKKINYLLIHHPMYFTE